MIYFIRNIKKSFSATYALIFIASIFNFTFAETPLIHKSELLLCPISANSGFTPVSCSGKTDGTAFVTVTGGSGDYSYNWSNAQTGATATTLSAATYTVTVTDNTGGCTATATVTVTQPPPISISMAKTEESCVGMMDGTATATPSGGNGTYTYSWTNGQTSQTATGLATGPYIVRVTDIKGCTKTLLVSIDAKPPLTISFVNTNVSCGIVPGSSVAKPSGGTPGYTYSWSTTATGSTSSGLMAGTYTLTVTDSKGCTKISTTTILSPVTPVTASTTSTAVLCYGENTGSARVTAGGGSGGFTYTWTTTPVQNTQVASGLTAGTYTVTVTDGGGCTKTATATITQPAAPITANTTKTDVLCFGGKGTATIIPAGGTPAYTYTWNTTPLQHGSTASNVSAGSYTVTVADNNGCTYSSSVTITQPPLLVPSITGTNLTCYKAGNGKANTSVVGGVTSYTYNWSSGQTVPSPSDFAAGSYTLTVTDANGCTSTSSVTLTEPPSPITNEKGLNVSCAGYNDGKAWVTPNGSKPTYIYAWNPNLSINDTIFNLTAGSYSVTVTDGNGCKQSTIVTITEPPVLTGTVTSVNSSCNSATDGTATITPSGGTAPYTYLWNTIPAQNTATANNLGPGTFTIKLSDANGCEFYSTVTISEAAPIFINNPTITKETCLLGNGKASVTVIGGTGTYSYTWNPTAQTSSTANNLSAGTYTVTVSDSKGCSTTKTAVVTNQFTPPTTFATTANNVLCNAAGNGSVYATPSAGTPPYSLSWSPTGGAGVTANNLTAGTYTVNVTDANGCTATSTTVVTEPPPMNMNPSSTNVTCGLINGTASVAPTGGTQPYTYSWSNSSAGATASGLGAGTYTVTVTDAGNCTQSTSITISITNPLSLTPSSTNVLCNGASTGSANVTASGGTGVFNYTWAPSGGPGATASSLTAGTYTVTVSDAGNAACSGTKTFVITEPTPLTAPITVVDISCAGNNSGQVSVSPTGGVLPYTYLWTNAATSSTISSLTAGGYTVTVTDANGCTQMTNGTVVQNSSLSASVAGTNVLCFGKNTGSAVVTVNGGSTPYTYKWAPSGGVSATASNLTANTYTVTVTDASGCTVTSTTTITQPPLLTVSATKTDATCGSNNGTGTATPAGGTTPYTYSWSDATTNPTTSNLVPASYTVVVTDANGCTASSSVTVAISNAITYTKSKTDIKCNGDNNGIGTLTPSGGSGVYNYNWMPGAYSTGTVNNLSPGTYTITISDAGNALCSTTTTITITEPAVLDANVTGTNISCNGSNNGQAVSAPTGGASPYTFNWSNAGTSGSITGLAPGPYVVTVTDANGCTTTDATTITQGSALLVTIDSQTDVKCSGESTGSVVINASGGTGTLTYLWSPAGGVGATATNLTAQTYTVSINDANGCASTLSITITEPLPLNLSSATTTATCGVSDGTATISPTDGTPAYTYLWNNGQTTANIIGLAPNTYTVTVTDANGCSGTTDATVIVGNPITLITNKTDLTCNSSNDGTTGVTSSGGTGTYNYTWAPGGAATTGLSGLSAGTYTVTVSDAVNSACTASAVINVTEPNPLTVALTPSNIVCYGQTNGAVTSTPNGGTPNYTYNWGPTSGTGSGVNNLGVGDYTVTVTDANGCETTQSASVTEPPKLVLTMDSVNVSCIGAYDGSIVTNVSGGVPTYTYQWAPAGGPTDSIGGLGPGTYTVTVTDANGCTIIRSITITEPPPFHITTGKIDPTCYLNNGLAWVSVTGGSGSFSFTWTPGGSNNDSIFNLAPGTYQVRVVDNATGCDTIGTETLAWPVIALALDSQNVSCNGFNNAKAWVTASGATQPYTYSWSFGASTTDTITGLSPGSYTVTVNDNGGCVSTSSISVTEPTVLSITKISTNVSCSGGANGSAGITASGGTAPYTYSWSSGQTTNNISNLSMGTYKITLTDSLGCVLVDSILITNPSQLTVTTDSVPASCFGVSDGEVKVITNGGTGKVTYLWNPGGATDSTVTGLTSGIYTVTITDANGCTISKAVEVIEPALLTITMSKVDPNCGQSNGKASVNASGGNTTYTYQWMPGSSPNDTIVNLSLGSYSVTVTDNKGCSAIDSVALTEPDVISILTNFTNVKCFAANDGTADVTATGGSGNYIYSWNPGNYSAASISGLAPGTYTVTVKDQANTFCAKIDSVTITEPTALTISSDTINIRCFGNGDGTTSVTVTGGTLAYTYTWSNGATSDSISNLTPAIYSVTVTDANACTITASISITQPALLTATADSVNSTCSGYNNGKVFVMANGGVMPYSYLWSPGNSSNDTLNNLSPGTYSVTVTDANNCTATDVISVTEPTGTTLTMNHTNTACGSNIGTASVTASGGNSPFSYLWSTGSTAATINGLFKGTYVVTTTDSKGCTKADSVKVTEPNGIVISFAATNVSCNGASDGKVTVTATGGTGSYIYSWVPSGNTNTTRNGLSAGTYIIKVLDATNLICSTIDTVIITQPNPITTTFTITNVTCTNDSNGIAKAIPAGGTAPYTYSWSNGKITQQISNIIAGTYTVSITDIKGCTMSSSVMITQPTPLSVATSIKKATCGNTDGEAYVKASGGTAPYTYSWTPMFSANDTLTGLLPGKYYVYVNDTNNCTKKDSVEIILSNGITTNLTSVSTTCFGDKDGQATVTANGGSGLFTYQWMPGNNSNQNIVNLAPGMYTVTVTDVNINGCIKIDSVLVPEPLLLEANVLVTKNSCGGTNDYIVTANPTGGTPGYTYTWSFGGTNQTEINLTPGSYIVAVTDSKGCDTAQIFTINSSSSPFILPPVKVNPKCNLSNGSVSVTIFGGMPPYTYAWSPSVSTGPTANNLPAGVYTLTVTDAYNCSDSRTMSIINTALPPNVSASSSPAICFGTTTGIATAITNAGSPPYTYSWGPSGGNNTVTTGVGAGIYTITVTDAQECTATSTTIVTEPPDITILLTPKNVSCFGGTDGGLTAIVGGGSPAYTFSWSSGGSTLTESPLPSGLYTLSVTDSHACTKSDTVRVTEPPVLAANINVINNVYCNGGSNGRMRLSTTGGTPNYTFSWSPAGGIDSVSTTLPAGLYTVSVTDAMGCTLTQTSSLTHPTPFTAMVVQTNVSCYGGNDGKARVIVSGSSAPYIYSWAPMSNFTDSVSNISAGSYTLHVVDSLGCPFVYIDTIKQPSKLLVNITPTNIKCKGDNNGSATISTTGGTPLYSYLWDASGSTNAVDSNLIPGTYKAYASDANGCIDSATVSITEPPALTTLTSKTDLKCYNDSSGSAFVTAGGGTPGYSYSWVPGNFVTSGFISAGAGNYTVAVTDLNGCVKIDSVTITQPNPIDGNVAQTNVICFGKQTGSASLTASGGTPGYSYSWNTGSATSAVSPLFAGTYHYTITDSKGCLLADSVVITQSMPISTTLTASPEKCYNSCDGQIIALPSNGVGSYTYSWSDGSSNSSISSLCIGDYTVQVTDANGCTSTSSATITQPTKLILTTGSTTAHCNQSDGTANINATGATPAYTYLWSPGGNTSDTLKNVAKGIYTVIVSDQNNCIDSAKVSVGDTNGPDASISSTTVTNCSNACTGKATSQVTGGTGPYTYLWNTSPPQSTFDAQNLCVGSYFVSITDMYGCSDTAMINIKAPVFDVQMNVTDTNICIGQSSQISATVTGGAAPYTFNWNNGAFSGPVYSVTPAVTTTYTLVVTDANGCEQLPVTVTITVKAPIVVTAMVSPPAACPGTSFTVTATATGGNGNYTFTWMPGSMIGNTLTFAPNVTSTFTVSAGDGCGSPQDTATVTLTVFPDPVVRFGAPDSAGCLNTCTNFFDHSTVAAGSTIVSWHWQFGDGQTSDLPNPTHCYRSEGKYNVTLTIKTDKGCTKILVKPNYINIYGLPKAGFDLNPKTVTQSEPLVNFTDMSVNALKWKWNFGDGSTIDSINYLQNPHHTYNDTGKYCVWQIVTNYSGCVDSTEQCLYVTPEYTFYIPNAFTPNGDGINDTFNGKGTNIKKYKMMVFDRWGNLIYVTNSLYLDWDGRANNGDEVAQQDVYVWKVALTDVFDIDHAYVGHVTLVK